MLHPKRGAPVSTAEDIRQLRGRLEQTLKTPAIVTVTSALRGDGKSLTAFGLASSFAEAGYTVAIVDVNYLTPTLRVIGGVKREFELRELARRNFERGYDEVALGYSQLPSLLPKRLVAKLAQQLRESYDYVFVDTGPGLTSNVALLFAGEADGTLVAVRAGRSATDTDAKLMEGLRGNGATRKAREEFGPQPAAGATTARGILMPKPRQTLVERLLRARERV
jgi:Mrp family chromosome partitioning ATPase